MTIFGGDHRAHLNSADVRLELKTPPRRKRHRGRGFKSKAHRLAYRAAAQRAHTRPVSWLVAFERTRALRLRAAEGVR